MKRALSVGLVALAIAGPAWAQVAGEARFAATTLDIAGHGEALAPPDVARITLGVSAQGATAAEAMSANAAAMSRVVAALHGAGLSGPDIQTTSLSLNPQYADRPGQPQRLTGYEADNEVTATLTDLPKLGAVVDAAVGAGANTVGQIRFELKNRASAENFARLAAVKDLDDKAALYAEAAGYHIRRLVNLSEGGAEPTPVRVASFARMAAATPIETGALTVSVDVTGEFELAR